MLSRLTHLIPFRLRLVAAALSGFAVIGAATVLGLFFLYDRGWISFNHPDGTRFPIRGIDVSHHQGRIDWKAVAGSGVRFAYIKATEGGDFVDPMFEQNWQASRDAGLLRGAYHFFTLCRSAREQAENFIKTVPREANTLPPVLDLEFGGNCSRRPDRDEVRAQIRELSARLRERYGMAPVLYTTGNFLEAYGESSWMDHLWIRDILFEPGRPFLFWQYTSRGRSAGIEGFVDMNVFRWTELELQALVVE